MITDADRTLAAELGLLLVRQPPSKGDDAQIIEVWTVKVALTKRPVGRLNFTSVNSLYVNKFASSQGSIEETVADALRWVAPIVRHARTHEEGTQTECGAQAAGADFSPIAAKSALINGAAGELCSACRAKLEARGDSSLVAGWVHDLSGQDERRGSSSPRQRSYIRRLLDEAARCGRFHLVDARTVDPMSSRSASATIDALRSLKAREWKGDL